MNETEVQDKLAWEWNKGGILDIPNCKGLGYHGEADFIRLTKSLLVHEVEIKRSFEDYKKDFDKGNRKGNYQKHSVLESYHEGSKEQEYSTPPNYFWFATTFELEEEVPEYAGHLLVEPSSIETKKKAPRIHSEKASERVLRYIGRGLNIRYWNLRDSI